MSLPVQDPVAVHHRTIPSTPWHVWVVGSVSLLWNAFGAFDYVMTQTQDEAYMGQFTDAQLAYFYGFPSWVVAAWAVGVWFAVLGSLLLLLRSRWAAAAFGLSIAGMVTSSVYTLGLSNGVKVMGLGAVVFSAVIWLVAIALFVYSRRLAARGVLR